MKSSAMPMNPVNATIRDRRLDCDLLYFRGQCFSRKIKSLNKIFSDYSVSHTIDPYTRSIIKTGIGEDINDAQQIGRHCLNKFEILRILRSGNVSC